MGTYALVSARTIVVYRKHHLIPVTFTNRYHRSNAAQDGQLSGGFVAGNNGPENI